MFHIDDFISSSLPDLSLFLSFHQTVHSSDLSCCNTVCIRWLCCVKIPVSIGLSTEHLAGPQRACTIGPWSFCSNTFATTPQNKPSIPSSLFSRVHGHICVFVHLVPILSPSTISSLQIPNKTYLLPSTVMWHLSVPTGILHTCEFSHVPLP